MTKQKTKQKTPEDPGYWAERVGAAENYNDLFEALVHFRQQLGDRFRPFNVLALRLLFQFGQQKSEKDRTPEREAAIKALTEVSLYLALVGGERAGFTTSMTTAIARKALSEAEADIACVASSLKGFERSTAEARAVTGGLPVSPTARKFASLLGGENQDETAKVIQLAIEEACAGERANSPKPSGPAADYETGDSD